MGSWAIEQPVTLASSPTRLWPRRHEDIVLRATIGLLITPSLIGAEIAALPEGGFHRQPLARSTDATGITLATRRANKA